MITPTCRVALKNWRICCNGVASVQAIKHPELTTVENVEGSKQFVQQMLCNCDLSYSWYCFVHL